MNKLKVFLNKLLYGIPEPKITQNPTVLRKMKWRGESYALLDKKDKSIIGIYEVYQ